MNTKLFLINTTNTTNFSYLFKKNWEVVMYNMYELKPLFIVILSCLLIALPSCTPNVIPSGNANLANLIFNYGNLVPAFNSEILDYSLTVEYTINEINFTATLEDNQASLNYRWQPAGESWSKWYELSSGIPSSDSALNTGNNAIEIVVESSDGMNSKKYSITVIKEDISSQNIAELNNLKIIYTYGATDYSLLYRPVFESNTTEYKLFLIARTKDMGGIIVFPVFNIIPYSDEGTIQINGEDVPSGEKKSFLILSDTTYEILVIAQDGVTTKTYHLNVYNYLSINEAVENNNDLTDGDVITAIPEHYEEDSEVVFPDKAILLMSLDPQDSVIRDNTIIDGCNLHRVISIKYLDKIPTLRGFTIQNGSAINGAGIYINNASANILYNKITQNCQSGTFYGSGGGIGIYQSSPHISYNTITENENGSGAGISIGGNSSPQIEHNNMKSNNAKYFGGGISLDNVTGTPYILYNTISYNDAGNYGGGIYCNRSSPVIHSNANISNNKAEIYGGGIYILICSPEIKDNRICDNWAIQHGGGIYITGEDSEPEIVDNVKIFGNEFGQWIKNPDDIYIESGNPTINNNGGPPVVLP